MSTQTNFPAIVAMTLAAALTACGSESVELDDDAALEPEVEVDSDPEPERLSSDIPPSELPGAAELLTSPDNEIPIVAPLNLAFGKPTIQSSTAYGGDSSRAVDGNTDGVYWNASVSHTATGPSWWQVDLGAIEPIGEVVVHNRTDCCADRLHDFDLKVSVDGVHWEAFHQPGVAGTQTHVLVDRRARYVRVDNPEVLQLAEVEVFATRNLAYGKPATQSSTVLGADASRAVDGNTDGLWWNNSVTHTADGPSEWWMVDLEAAVNIGHVVLFNRTDCCAERLHDFVVRVSNDGQNWHAIPFAGPVPDRQILVPVNREARYVRIDNGAGPLHLAEVQVFEGPRAPGMSYGRGVGTVPSYGCALGEVMDAGLCYPACSPGYTGVLTVCWENCAPGYTDHGLTCTNWGNLHTYSKGAYDRGIGKLPIADCGPGQQYDAGLCYPVCGFGYHGVGPVCWSDSITIESISQEFCRAFRSPLIAQLADQIDTALTTGIGLGVAVGLSASAELGFAYGDDGEFGCYASACAGATTAIEINAYASMGLYYDFDNIAGSSNVTSIGASIGIPIPNTPISAGIGGQAGIVSSLDAQPLGSILSVSASLGQSTPIGLSNQTCHTEMLQVF